MDNKRKSAIVFKHIIKEYYNAAVIQQKWLKAEGLGFLGNSSLFSGVNGSIDTDQFMTSCKLDLESKFDVKLRRTTIERYLREFRSKEIA